MTSRHCAASGLAISWAYVGGMPTASPILTAYARTPSAIRPSSLSPARFSDDRPSLLSDFRSFSASVPSSSRNTGLRERLGLSVGGWNTKRSSLNAELGRSTVPALDHWK
ncbi:hypothetical protein PF010_g12207 [Phytophthora fragariae]|uniref:Uncharacterized protein n=1 Tax=Phytophthora fragariae TaxID=53985 RepID=A0A6A3KH72_9STRA|nr:hypothetical protein PF011_g11597 [Phytophthora fragariae]KAE9107619.1 hypothetical protein PF010_g12207 [Phytophthora fragariae]KAE9227018.1 hypothetical protein PF004_g11476 [Phytophthora fragariae]